VLPNASPIARPSSIPFDTVERLGGCPRGIKGTQGTGRQTETTLCDEFVAHRS
jgi:hypothetical protein